MTFPYDIRKDPYDIRTHMTFAKDGKASISEIYIYLNPCHKSNLNIKLRLGNKKEILSN